MIPISAVAIGAEEEALVLEVLRSGQLAQGPKVAQLEAASCAMAGTAHAVAVNSGTAALVLALKAIGVGPGDEVITTPFTFAATLNAIIESGATARFADIGADFNLDASYVEALINDRTKAVLPVHLYGHPAEMSTLSALASGAGAALVEDCAQAHGATFDGRPVGGFGVGCFSFYATKNISSGEGGVVTTDDAALADRMRILRNQGMRARYDYVVPGHNYRMTDVIAAIAIPQFARLGDIVGARQANAAALSSLLADVVGIAVPVVSPNRTHVWHQYTIRLDVEAGIDRANVVAELERQGVGCGVYYPNLAYDYDCYRSHPSVVVDPCPNASQAAASVLSLPVHSGVTDADLEHIADAVARAVRC